jgi:hypothetical protein
MSSFKSTSKFNILSIIGIFNGIILILLSTLLLSIREYLLFISFFTPGFILLYLLLFVFPSEVVVDDEVVLFKSILRSVIIPYSNIKELKLHYTTRTLIMSGGDREKAVMFYSIKLKGKPLNLMMFGGGISNYRDLYKYLAEKSGAPIRSGRELWRT